MTPVTIYQCGLDVALTPAAGGRSLRLLLAPHVRIGISPRTGRHAFYRADGSFGIDLQTALDAGWCRLASDPD